ncbi:hypothetical protein ACXJJ3_06740 [Kribbella sp. WER1]
MQARLWLLLTGVLRSRWRSRVLRARRLLGSRLLRMRLLRV